MIKTQIVVRLQVEGLHNWPQAAAIEPQVDFLAQSHRHIFFIEAKKSVTHDDRDIEIILFKRSILAYLYDNYSGGTMDNLACNFGPMSCEMIAKEIQAMFELDECSVYEDNENGAIVTKI